MNGKKVLGFLLLKPAFNSRNLTSLALVALFFGVYVASGGKVTSVPKLKAGAGGFGSVTATDSGETLDEVVAPGSEVVPADDSLSEEAALPAKRKRSTLFDDSNVTEKSQPSREDVVIEHEAQPDRSHSADGLVDIEKRLKGVR